MRVTSILPAAGLLLSLVAAQAPAATVTYEAQPAPRSLVPQELLPRAGDPLDQYERQLRARVDADAADAQGWHALGTVLFHKGEEAGAREAWARAHDLDRAFAPADVMADVQRIYVLQNRGDAKGARLHLSTVETRRAADPYFHLMRAEQAMRAGAVAQAGEAYEQARRLAPDFFMTSLNLGRFLEFAGDHEAARRRYEEAARSAPDRAAPWDFLGAHQFAQGDAAAALESLRAAEDADPDQPLAEVRLAEFSAGAGDYIGARRWLLRALDRAETGHAAIRVALGDAQLRLGLLDEARETLDAVLAEERSAPLLVARGYVDERAGDVAAAAERYRDAVRADPGNVVASNNLAMAMVRLDRNPEEALAHARHAFSVRPDNAAIYGTHAVALAHAGEIEEALPALRRAVRIAPDDPWARYFLGKLLRETDADEARAQLEAATILDPAFPRRAEIERLLSTP
jgi:tetratricopeptide (TPR) repeat protein